MVRDGDNNLEEDAPENVVCLLLVVCSSYPLQAFVDYCLQQFNFEMSIPWKPTAR